MHLHYIRQWSGSPYSVTETRFVGNLAAGEYLHGVNAGRDWFDFGLGADIYRSQRWNVFIDGGIETSRHTFSAAGSLRAVYQW
ncbi:MAG: hypothetical protein LBT46_12655 [Planctomycetaceae bacterium]|jgi:hypothetical protein|nr:hypothetical protein [Planctomycetaceae bacterium]